MDKLKIYSSSGVYIRDIDSVISCSFRDSLAGECSLEFSLLSSDCVGISEDGLIQKNCPFRQKYSSGLQHRLLSAFSELHLLLVRQ